MDIHCPFHLPEALQLHELDQHAQDLVRVDGVARYSGCIASECSRKVAIAFNYTRSHLSPPSPLPQRRGRRQQPASTPAGSVNCSRPLAPSPRDSQSGPSGKPQLFISTSCQSSILLGCHTTCSSSHLRVSQTYLSFLLFWAMTLAARVAMRMARYFILDLRESLCLHSRIFGQKQKYYYR